MIPVHRPASRPQHHSNDVGCANMQRRDFVVGRRSRPGGGSRPLEAIGRHIITFYRRACRAAAAAAAGRFQIFQVLDFDLLIFRIFISGFFKFDFSLFAFGQIQSWLAPHVGAINCEDFMPLRNIRRHLSLPARSARPRPSGAKRSKHGRI